MNATPALLVAYNYLRGFEQMEAKLDFRDWVLDSGAYAAETDGVKIDLYKYIEDCRRLKEQYPRLKEVFALDVIYDWKKTLRNTEKMWEAGVQAIPAFHFGSPWQALEHLARTYPKIALGGISGMRGKGKVGWVGQCFARAWPKRIHGFGLGAEQGVMEFPWDSVDGSNWKQGALRFSVWKAYRTRLRVKSRSQVPYLRPEIVEILKIESRHKAKWDRIMKRDLGDDYDGPMDHRLAANWDGGGAAGTRVFLRSLGKKEFRSECEWL